MDQPPASVFRHLPSWRSVAGGNWDKAHGNSHHEGVPVRFRAGVYDGGEAGDGAAEDADQLGDVGDGLAAEVVDPGDAGYSLALTPCAALRLRGCTLRQICW